MSHEESPYVNQCAFCGDGLLRLYRCTGCKTIVAMCDECELIWCDIAEISLKANRPSDGAFPACPVCQPQQVRWVKLDRREIGEANLDAYLA